MGEITYRRITSNDVDQLAELHLKSLQDGLLYDLGEKYTRLFYRVGLGSNNCFGYAVEKEGALIGAAVSTKNINHLFRKLLLNPRFLFGIISRMPWLRNLYPSAGTAIPIKQEFILFFIHQNHRNLSTALKLMKLIEEEYTQLGYHEYSLEVKEDNLAANLLYQRFGFIKTHEVGAGQNKRIFYKKVINKN